MTDAATWKVLEGRRAAGWSRRDTEWRDLWCFNYPGTRDKRTAAAIYSKLGLHPILIHGFEPDGLCTCGKLGGCGKSSGKHPVDKGWQHQGLDAKRLDEELTRCPAYNVGLRMGEQPCGWFLVAIDIDGPREMLGELEVKLGALPSTLEARTGGGGTHLIFRSSKPMGNRAAILKNDAGQIDLRGAGGQIVVSPSRHRSGNHYEWTQAIEPSELPL